MAKRESVVCPGFLRSLGLVEEYENIEQFRRKLSKQLQVCLNQNPYLQRVIRDSGESDPLGQSDARFKGRSVNLSEDAITLLRAAASDKDGTILNVHYIGGHDIQAGGKTFGGASARESARWENALKELVERGLVVERGYKGEMFELTHQGWAVADGLQPDHRE